MNYREFYKKAGNYDDVVDYFGSKESFIDKLKRAVGSDPRDVDTISSWIERGGASKLVELLKERDRQRENRYYNSNGYK